MAKAAKTKKSSRVILRLIIIAAVSFVALNAVRMHMQIKEKEETLSALKLEKAHSELMLEDLQEHVNHPENNLEKQVRENGYVFPGEQIYRIIPDN